jgi:hypothetical protein
VVVDVLPVGLGPGVLVSLSFIVKGQQLILKSARPPMRVRPL